jgi:hypothetical protein
MMGTTASSDPKPEYDGPTTGSAYVEHRKILKTWQRRQQRIARKAEPEPSTSMHVERLGLPLISNDVSLALQYPPPSLHDFIGKKRDPNDSAPKVWFFQMTGLDWDMSTAAWNAQTSRHRHLAEDKNKEKMRQAARELTRERPLDDAARVVQQWHRRTEERKKQAALLAATEKRRFEARLLLLKKLFAKANIDLASFFSGEVYVGSGVVADFTFEDYARGYGEGQPFSRDHAYVSGRNIIALSNLLTLHESFEDAEHDFDDDAGFVAKFADLCLLTEAFHNKELDEYGNLPREVEKVSFYHVLSDIACQHVEVRRGPGIYTLAGILWDLGAGELPTGRKFSPIWLPRAQKWVGVGSTLLNVYQLQRLRAACVMHLSPRDFSVAHMRDLERGISDLLALARISDEQFAVLRDDLNLITASMFDFVLNEYVPDPLLSTRNAEDGNISDDTRISSDDEGDVPGDVRDVSDYDGPDDGHPGGGPSDDAFQLRNLNVGAALCFYLKGIPSFWRGHMEYYEAGRTLPAIAESLECSEFTTIDRGEPTREGDATVLFGSSFVMFHGGLSIYGYPWAIQFGPELQV